MKSKTAQAWPISVSAICLLGCLSAQAASLVKPPKLVQPSPTEAQRTDEWRYTLAPGDTLIGLANRLMKPPADWQKLQSHNRFANPQLVLPGQVVRIPLAWLRSDATVATVLLQQGVVNVRRGTARLASVVSGTEILPGDQIETGVQSTLSMQFIDGSRIAIAPRSKVLIESLLVYGKSGITETRLKIDEGAVESTVVPLKNVASKYVVTTPVFNLGVRGTEFRARYDSATQTAFSEVGEGSVAAQGRASPVLVGAGFGTLAVVNTEPKTPKALLAAPELRGIEKTLTQVPLQFTWAPEPGAAAYRAQVFADKTLTRQITEGVFNQPSARWLNLPDGAYVLRVRSIDAEGLEGAGKAVDFELNARPEAPFPNMPGTPDAASLAFGSEANLRWTEPPEAAAYRVQVSDNPGFQTLLLDRKDIVSTEVKLALPSGTYYWRVATVTSSGKQGPFGDVQKIVLRNSP